MTTERSADVERGGETKRRRYERITAQLEERFADTADPTARMATAAALLHHKMAGFMWTGFYLLCEGDLVVGPYQGPLACLVLARHTGVCWAGVDRGETVVVPDVHAFPGHIACDSRSSSEIVVPLYDASGRIIGVLDVDSTRHAHFDDIDAECLERIAAMIHRHEARGTRHE
jgi:L-methionine (R)-S-oxide reductase